MWYRKKIIAWLLVFAILIFSLCVPSFAATDPAPTDSRGDFYDWAMRPGGSFGGDDRETFGGGRPNYDEWVSTLPATGYNSAGRLIWHTYDSFDGFGYGDLYWGYYAGDSSYHSSLVSQLPYSINNGYVEFSVSLSEADKSLHFSRKPKPNSGGHLNFAFGYSLYIKVPMSGSYRLMESLGATYRYVDLNTGNILSGSESFLPGSVFEGYNFGDRVRIRIAGHYGESSSGSAIMYFPYFEVIPDTAIDTTPGGQYNTTTITGGNYGIVGDDNNITTVTNTTQIVNEGNVIKLET